LETDNTGTATVLTVEAMAKNKTTYADVVARVDAHLYNALFELTAAIFGGMELTDEQRKLLVAVSSNLAHLKNALNPTGKQ